MTPIEIIRNYMMEADGDVLLAFRNLARDTSELLAMEPPEKPSGFNRRVTPTTTGKIKDVPNPVELSTEAARTKPE